MASSGSDSNKSSSRDASSNSYPVGPDTKVEDLVAWSLAHQNDRLDRCRIKRSSISGGKHHAGPIRITRMDGFLTKYGERLERERLAKLAADANEGQKEDENRNKEVDPSS